MDLRLASTANSSPLAFKSNANAKREWGSIIHHSPTSSFTGGANEGVVKETNKSFKKAGTTANEGSQELQKKAEALATTAFTRAAGVGEDDVSSASSTSLFGSACVSLRIRALEDFLKSDRGLAPRFLYKKTTVRDVSNPLVKSVKHDIPRRSTKQLATEAETLVKEAFAHVLDLDEVDASTNFFENGGGSLQIVALQEYLNADNGQDPLLRQKVEQHLLFTNPTVGDVVALLVKGIVAVPRKNAGELKSEAKTLVEEAFMKVLGLKENEVDTSTNFFESGGGSLQVVALQEYLKTDNGQDSLLQQKIEQHVLFSNPTVGDVVQVLVEKASKIGAEAGSAGANKEVERGLVNSGKFYPASWQQEQTFVLNASGAGAAYNMPWIVDFKGWFDRDAMVEAHDFVVRREQPLRTVLRLNNKKTTNTVQQQVLPKSTSRSLWELCEHESGTFDEAIAILEKEQDYNFDITKAPISRLHIVKVSETRHVVMCNSHHVHHDTGSVVTYRRHVLEAYIANCEGKAGSLDDSDREYDYLAFSLWQRNVMTPDGQEYKNQLGYWLKELDGARPLSFPRDLTATSEDSGGDTGGQVTLRIEPDIAMQWKTSLSKSGCTPFMGGMTLLHILLSRWFNEKDIVTGAAIANRDAHPSYSERLGCFRNVLPIRSNSADNPTYGKMLQQVKDKILRSWTAKEIPYHEVIANMGDREFRGFNCMYAFQDAEWHHISTPTSHLNFKAKVTYLTKTTTKFDVHLMLRWNVDGGVDGDLIYASTKFGKGTMKRFAEEFVNMATHVATQSMEDVSVLKLPMVCQDDLSVIQDTWNESNPVPSFPPPQSVALTVFQSIQERWGGDVAVQYANGTSCTFAQLHEYSMAMSRGIQDMLNVSMPVTQDHQPRIALIFRNGVPMYASLLAVLSIGGVVIPVDASHTPTDRVLFILKDSGANAVIYDDRSIEFVSNLLEQGRGTCLPEFYRYDMILGAGSESLAFKEEQGSDEDDVAIVPVSGEHHAYILYTSGTSGRPKGVIITHANIHNSIHWWMRLVDLKDDDKVLHFSSYSFVMSLRQIYPTFVAGATLVVPESALEFGSAIAKCGVTKMALTPSALGTVDPEACPTLQVIQVAGEAPPKHLARRWASRLESFFIGLGPTELSGHACCGQFQANDEVNIGNPVNNAAVYILNEAGEIQPPNVVGELCVAGDDVALGYLNREELTRKHFVANPFDSKKTRMFKTGDLARRLPDGRIEFVGRSDSQIKIRGFRIEVAEIVQAITDSNLVRQVEVIPSKGVDDQMMLVAYVTPLLDKQVLNDLRSRLSRRLPSYMVPQHLFALDDFPLNKNGKLDRSRLPDPGNKQSMERVVASSKEFDGLDLENPIVSLVFGFFAAELHLKDAEAVWRQRERSFFDIGGTSLTAVRSVRHISEKLSIELKVTDLILHDTLYDFTTYVVEQAEGCNELRPVTADDIMEVPGIETKRVGTAMGTLAFAAWRALATVTLLTFSLVLPFAIGGLTVGAILDWVGFPLILPLLPVIYAVVAVSNLFTTRLVFAVVAIGRRDTAFAYPVKSSHFIRWWLIRRMMALTSQLFWFANGSVVIVWVYRFLGARIGSGVTIDNVVCDIPSLSSIGDNCAIGFNTRLVCGEIRGDFLFVAPVVIEPRVKTEPRSSITPGAKVPKDCIVRAWACVTADLPYSQDPRDIIGSPAAFKDQIDPSPFHVPSITHSFGYYSAQILLMYLLAVISFVGIGITCFIGINVLGVHGKMTLFLYFVIAGLPVAFAVLLLAIVLTKRTILNRPRPNVVHTGPLFYIKVWFIDTLLLSPFLSLALEYLLPPSMYHYFLMAMGGKAGKHAFWNSPQMRAGLEHISIGEVLHSGFMQIWSTQKVTSEGITFKPIMMGNDCTIGQRTVVMPGINFGNEVTVGSEGVVLEDMDVLEKGTVIGNPPRVFVDSKDRNFAVNQLQDSLREVMAERGESMRDDQGAEIDIEGSVVVFNIVAVAMNILKLPLVVANFVGSYFLFSKVVFPFAHNTEIGIALLASATYLFGAFVMAMLLALLTRSGLASFRHGYTGYYTSRFIVWWFCLWLNRFSSGLVMYPFHGTIIFNAWLRLIGATIGKRCLIDPGFGGLFEIDNIKVGEGSLLMTPNIHGHFVDHGKLQFATVRIGSNVRVNDGATIMPFTSISDDITLLTQCTTIKAMELKSPGIYMGNVAFHLETQCEKKDMILVESFDREEIDDEHLIDDQENSQGTGLRIVLIGQQAFGAAVLERLLENGENVVAVCGNPSKEGKPEDPLVVLARERGLEVHQPKSWKTPEAQDLMKSFTADFCLLAYVTKIIPTDVLNAPKYGSVCFHPSLLPHHRGPSSISWAIATGKTRTGVSVFWPNEGIDEGPIFIQKECDIGPDETLGDLYSKKLFPMGVDAMLEAVVSLGKGKIVKTEQNPEEGSYESWFRNEAVQLDFSKPVEEIYNVIRAANPSPGATTSVRGETVKIFDCIKLNGTGGVPGEVVELGDDGILIQAHGGRILVKRIGTEAGSRHLASQWAADTGVTKGSRFGQ